MRLSRSVTVLMSCSLALGAALVPISLSGQTPATTGAQVPVAIPDTPAGRQFAAWLEAFNAADAARLEAIRQNFAPGATIPPAEATLAIRARSGGFDVRAIEEASERRLVVLLAARADGQAARLTLDLDAENRVLGMPVRAIVARLDDRALAAQLGTELDRLAREDQFSGVVVVLKDGRPLFSQAYGQADRERQVPNRIDGKFRIGSMGKMFTATAVVQLIQAGKISLSDPIGRFLPDYPNPEVAKVTIEQLLTHTGGTGDIFTPEFMEHVAELDSPERYVALFGGRAPAFTPGSRYAYSNYGYVLLGRVIEVASGESYYDYLQHHIFDPLGMTSTGFWRESEPLAGRVTGYDPAQAFQATPGVPTDRASPAGGATSSVADMLRFAQGLLEHELLDAAHTALLTTGRVTMGGPGMKYALGFGDLERGTRLHAFGHNGGAPGQNGDLKVYPEAGYVTVVLSNFSPPAAARVADFIANRIGG